MRSILVAAQVIFLLASASTSDAKYVDDMQRILKKAFISSDASEAVLLGDLLATQSGKILHPTGRNFKLDREKTELNVTGPIISIKYAVLWRGSLAGYSTVVEWKMLENQSIGVVIVNDTANFKPEPANIKKLDEFLETIHGSLADTIKNEPGLPAFDSYKQAYKSQLWEEKAAAAAKDAIIENRIEVSKQILSAFGLELRYDTLLIVDIYPMYENGILNVGLKTYAFQNLEAKQLDFTYIFTKDMSLTVKSDLEISSDGAYKLKKYFDSQIYPQIHMKVISGA